MFLNVFNVFLKIQKNMTLRFVLRCCTRFLEHWCWTAVYRKMFVT